MKTRKRKPVQVIDGMPVLDAANETPENAVDSLSEKPDRISFYVSPDGSPEWDRISASTKEKLTAILKNEKVQRELGITQEQAKSISEMGFGEDEANALLDLLGGIDAMAASAVYKIPPDICSKAFTFSPDQRKKINPPLQRILNKWSPMILKTWKDEIGLAMVLLSTLNAQVRVMHMLDEQRKKNTPPKPQATVTSISASEPKPETQVAKESEASFNVS
jgi:hypothetical protein